jgi:Zn-dependent peptidase ImmA (M78 family)
LESSPPDPKKIFQTVRELVDKGKLSDFQAELYLIIKEIYTEKCGIVCEDEEKYSRIEPMPFSESKPIIHIGLKDRESPVDIIWSILHEFGHLLQGVDGLRVPEKGKNFRYNRVLS